MITNRSEDGNILQEKGKRSLIKKIDKLII